MFLGNWDIDDYLTFTACTHDAGAAADADAVPSYAIYEDETAAAIVSGNMAKLGAVDGFYTERVQLTAVAGFEAGKMYAVRVEAVMGGVTAAAVHSFAVKVALANVTLWSGDAVAGAPALETTAQAILEDTGTMLPGLFAASGATVTVISAVDGGTITLHVGDTWAFTVSDSTLDLSDYETVALVVKRNARQIDNDALLYLRSDTGLARIGGAAPVSAGNGTLTKTSTSFSGTVALAETSASGLIAGQYTWWLKAFDTTPAPDEGYTLATGAFVLERAGLGAVS